MTADEAQPAGGVVDLEAADREQPAALAAEQHAGGDRVLRSWPRRAGHAPRADRRRRTRLAMAYASSAPNPAYGATLVTSTRLRLRAACTCGSAVLL